MKKEYIAVANALEKELLTWAIGSIGKVAVDSVVMAVAREFARIDKNFDKTEFIHMCSRKI